MRAVAIACAVWLLASAASAQETANALHINGQVDFLHSVDGGTGGVEWLRKTDRHGVHVGFQSGSRAEAWWTYGRAGGFIRKRNAIFAGTLDAGGGVQPGARFGYQKFAGELTVPLAAGRLLVETEGQLARMATDVRRILRLGFKWRASHAVTGGGSYYLVSLDRSLTPAVLARLDVERGRTSALGGVVFVRHARSTALLSAVGGTPLTSTEFFGGGGFRGRSYRLQMVANVARGDTSRLLVSLEIPLKR